MAEDSRYKEPPKIARLSQNAKADYYKPIVLPNHQTAFRRFTHATIIGNVSTYVESYFING